MMRKHIDKGMIYKIEIQYFEYIKFCYSFTLLNRRFFGLYFKTK